MGIAKFADVFPIPGYFGWLSVLILVAGFLLMTAAVILFSARLWQVSRPVYMRSDLEAVLAEIKDGKEKDAITKVYAEAARTNDASSLSAYEARGWRLRRIALRQSDPARRSALLEQSTLILTEVRTTQLRAAIGLIRQRASSVASGRGTWGVVALFAIGLIGVGIGSDWLDSERGRESREVAAAHACANATEAIVKQGLDPDELLPESCGRPDTTQEPAKPTPAERVTSTLDAVVEHYQTCVEEITKSGRTDTAGCTPQLQLIVQTTP